MAKIMIVNTSTDYFGNTEEPTGLWLSELVHFYDAFKHTNVDIDMFNITGGNTPIDPVSLNPLMFDNTTKAYYKNESFMDLLRYSQPIREAQPEKYDAIYFTGGHGVMYDFPENKYIQSAVNTIYENGGIVAAVCHGIAALLNVKDAGGTYLIQNKKITGFSNIEEVLAQRDTIVPFHLQNEIKKRGAIYRYGRVPFTSTLVGDGRVITGQNPQSPSQVGEAVRKQLL